MDLWQIYLVLYTIMAFGYLWYRYVFLFAYKNKIKYGDYSGKVSVIIPFYNEDLGLLVRTVKGVCEAKGEKQIIVVDDGSTDLNCYLAMLQMQDDYNFELLRYADNRGKRHAQCVGFRRATGDIIMTVDSDTVLDENAIVNLIKPFSDHRIGATTGNLGVLNEKKNFLTKLIAARYWNAFNFERKSQSTLGVVVCCTGPISAYRKSIIDEVIWDYEHQSFWGASCTYGDDRHLTTLVLKRGYDIRYVKNSIAYTYAQETWKQFIKQQVRWKKSWLRETYLVSKFMWKRSKALSFEILFSILLTFFSIFARVGLVVALLMHPTYILVAVPVILMMAGLHSMLVLRDEPRHFVYSVMYGIVHAFLVYWLLFVAMITFRDTKWGTR